MARAIDHDEFMKGVEILVKQVKASKKKFRDIKPIPRGGLVLAVYLSHRLGLPLNFGNPTKSTLVVDDIADSGETLENLEKRSIATLCYKKSSSVKPDFWAIEVDEWIVFPWETSTVEKRDKTFTRS